MNGTVIKHTTEDTEYRNLVSHECSFYEFLKDLSQEIEKFTKDQQVSNIDVFWHLDEYCDRKYGRCQWEVVTIHSLRFPNTM